MPLTKAERDAVIGLVTDAMTEAVGGFEREVDALRGRVQILEGLAAGRKSASPGGAAGGVALADRLAAGVRAYVGKVCGPLAARLATIEARGELVYRGTWTNGVLYRRGNFTTHGGSCWACLEDTRTAPPGAAWQLAVKRGSDAPSR